MKRDKIKFVPLTYTNGTKTYVKADAIVQLEEMGNETYVYTIGNDAPLYVKERVDEILAKYEVIE